jgi:hypothetical protein
MMKRKGIPRSVSSGSYFHGGGGSLLPVTQNDARRTVPSSRFRRRNYYTDEGGFGSINVSTAIKVVALVAVAFVSVTVFKRLVWRSDEFEPSSNYWQTLDQQKLPLSDYPSIQYALDHSDIVLLYFAASWCRMSTPVTELLDTKFGDILLPPESSGVKFPNKQRRPISLVYVSSDESEEQMLKYARKHWITIPFKSAERTKLKKKFKVAAKRELEVLDMERRYELPTIIIVSGESHNVVTVHGVDDLHEKGSEALIHWMKLLHTVRSLEDKY